jgi:hypothetical protein
LIVMWRFLSRPMTLRTGTKSSGSRAILWLICGMRDHLMISLETGLMHVSVARRRCTSVETAFKRAPISILVDLPTSFKHASSEKLKGVRKIFHSLELRDL